MATTLQRAKDVKNDEFYTQLRDIENELRHYKGQLEGKVIFCNCDDPYESNFFQFFAINFNYLKLKCLMTTSYKPSPIAYTQINIFGEEEPLQASKGMPKTDPVAYKLVINEIEDIDGNNTINIQDVIEKLKRNKRNEWTALSGNGDFRSAESVELLKKADIVITNPPFSLYRQYIAQLIEHDKQFLIIGDDNWVSLKETFALLQENKMWKGYGRVKEFRQPNGEIKKFGNKCWYTNLDTTKRHEALTLFKKYIPEEYPTYANFDAIEVSRVENIPEDYDGLMGVPITFLDKYNPEQFEIVGSSRQLGKKMSDCGYEKGTYVQGGVRFYLPIGDVSTHTHTHFKRLYDRIIIRKRKAEDEI